jgi:hypothetical protein
MNTRRAVRNENWNCAYILGPRTELLLFGCRRVFVLEAIDFMNVWGECFWGKIRTYMFVCFARQVHKTMVCSYLF